MGKVFFVDWALWQKMTFVLACAIVLTIFIGWLKVLYTNRKLKKLTKPVGARADQEPQMVEAAAAPRRKSGDDIPFGIRAIQSGIEVDGIWISGTNTPVPSSPTQSAQDKPEASGSNSRPMSALEIPGPATAGPSSGPSSRPSSRGPPSSSFDRAVSAERIASHSRDSSPGSTASGQRARTHRPPPTAYTRYSQASMLRHSATLDTLEGEEDDARAMHERSASASANPYAYNFSSNGSSRKSSGSSDNNPPDRSSDDDTVGSTSMGKAPMVAVPRSRDPRTDLRLLQSHRMSHVAETGSLVRRERPDRPTGRSGDWSSMSLDAPYSRSAPTSGPPSPPSGPTSGPPSPPTPPISQGANPFMAPLESVSSPTRDSHPENTVAHAVPLLETYQPRGPNFDDDTPQAYTTHDSQVLRKVNSGFEILRPGTFPVGPTEEALRAQQPPKKLQKKRRPSEADSRVSSFVEQV
ncbi:uncharacterized protein LTHEOB_9183 [Lasiodiplodia theobromae]|uniref:Uncharacterized protein n=1 Tax=Lasiodiplodia theobromae TaxID=45133 RepID=A0A5N5DI55_9PEZI|nr:uncharacterized protein LTHEOB_9183 [Lasiodiplodia theobromae]KAB2577523.1 hypothetical protein DBV05_g3856 [Lasiodiplodia theobromae]KAF4540512.1 hypothetical protein LTHEOB_9183 [Lasiodiplodia theobromae]